MFIGNILKSNNIQQLKKWCRHYKLFFVSESIVSQLPKLGGQFYSRWGKFPFVIKTNEQVKFEKEEEERKWAEYCQTLGSNVSDSDWDQWDNVEWEETPEEEQKTGRSL